MEYILALKCLPLAENMTEKEIISYLLRCGYPRDDAKECAARATNFGQWFVVRDYDGYPFELTAEEKELFYVV
jgi:hypothetical protein